MKRGFTLIELLVYMAIMGFIIVVAGRAYSDATGMRVRTQSMTKATEEVNRIAELFKEDLSQMGAKAWMSQNQGSSTADFFESGNVVFSDVSEPVMKEIYVEDGTSGDSSSFKLFHPTSTQGGIEDSIEFIKTSYDPDGKYIGTRLISWALSQDSILRRRCVTLHSPSAAAPDPDCPHATAVNNAVAVPVVMAEKVQRFTLYPSKPLDNLLEFGGEYKATNANPTFGLVSRTTGTGIHGTQIAQPSESNYNTATLSGSNDCDAGRKCFEKNDIGQPNQNKQHQVFIVNPFATPPSTTPTNFTNCEPFNFKKNETYAIKFKTPMNYMKSGNDQVPDSMMALFQPGVDHMAVGFRNSNGGPVSGMPTDFMFYPPQKNRKENDVVNTINQYFEFSVPNDVSNACIAFTLAFYSGCPSTVPTATCPSSASFGPHKGRLKIKDFELLRKTDGTYEFERDNNSLATFLASNEKKRNVKAFELILEVNKRNEIGSTRRQTENGDVIGYVIPVPNNGIVPRPPP